MKFESMVLGDCRIYRKPIAARGARARPRWWREACERAQSGIDRAVPPGGFRKPPVSAGVFRLVAGAADASRGSRKALHRVAHACRHVRELRLSAIFRSGRENGAHLSLRHECRRSPRTCMVRSRNLFPTRFPCSNSICCRSASNGIEDVRRHRRVQAALCVRVSSAPPADTARRSGADEQRRGAGEPIADVFPAASFADRLPEDGEVPDEVLEFFVPEAEEHLQAVTECLLALEAAIRTRKTSIACSARCTR